MTQSKPGGPVLFCFDGSDGSRGALRAAAEVIDPAAEVIILTVWEPIAVRLALSGAFAAGTLPSEGDLDNQEESYAAGVAKEGAQRASERGFKASALTKESTEGTAQAIMAVADEVSARLIVCGKRGRGPLKTALLGSVSHTLAAHASRPLLIAPETAG